MSMATGIFLSMSENKTLIKRVGGKTKIRDWLYSLFPYHNTFVDVFGGSFIVGLGLIESNNSLYRVVLNDIDYNIVNFFRVLRDEPDELIRRLDLTPYSREEFYKAHDALTQDNIDNIDDIERARLFIIYNRQSIFGKETRDWCISRQGENISHTWANLPSFAKTVSKKLKYAFIENLDYQNLIQRWDGETALHYLDPPYKGVEKNFYKANKKSGFDHDEMRKFLDNVKGSWAVSYYDSPFIRDLYDGFEFHEKKIVKHMQIKKTGEKNEGSEVLIINRNDYSKDKQEKSSCCLF